MTTRDALMSRQYLKLAEAADLGYGSVSTLRRVIRAGDLPAWRRGRDLYVRPEDLEALMRPVDAVGGDR